VATSSFEFDVRVDVAAAMAAASEESRQQIIRAAARALNRTATPVKNEAAKLIADQLGVKSSVVKKSLFINKASQSHLIAQVVAVGRKGVSLKELHPVQTSSGVTVRGGSLIPSDYPHAFIVKSLGGHVFERRGTERLPIDKLYAPATIPSAMVQEAVQTALNTIASQLWTKNFNHELEYRFS
jgi:hypothetical protein